MFKGNLSQAITRNLTAVMIAIVLTGLALSWSACSQDPLSGQSDAVRDAIPPGGAFKKPTEPEREDVLKVDVMNMYTFTEDVSGEIAISGRVLKQINGHNPVLGQDFTFAIANLADFAGATFDPVNYKFSWTPKAVTSGQSQVEKTLNVVISTIGTTPIQSRTWPVGIRVIHKEIDPEIRSVLPASLDLVSGESVQFNVVVYDPDTASSTTGGLPHLYALDAQRNGQSLAGYVKLYSSYSSDPNPAQDPANPALWTYRMILDTSGADLSGNLTFSLEAISRYGHKANQNVSVNVLPLLRDPVTTLAERMTVKSGDESTISFSVYDPLGRGSMKASITNCSSFPGVTECACTAYRRSSVSDCTIHWVVPTIYTSQNFYVYVEGVNSSPVRGDYRDKKRNFSSTINVVPLPRPTPAPSPSPAPPSASPTPDPGPTPEPSPVIRRRHKH